MIKHTPGPWSLHEHMGGENITDCLPEFTAHTAYIGAGDLLLGEFAAYKPGPEWDGVQGYPRVTDFEENRANARLIVAAPELLEALRDAVACLGGINSDNVPESVRAAIAKAHGETP